MVRSSVFCYVPLFLFLSFLPARAAKPKIFHPPKPYPPPSMVMVMDGSTVHDVGQLRMHVTNWGALGSWPGAGLPFSGAPSAEWPAGSGVEHLFAGGLWVGALKAGVPAVSTAAYEWEFRPTQDPVDKMYQASEGDSNGTRAPFPGADDDGDGLVDEDWLDGHDNDGDGLVDEDFAAISDQMMSCWYTDNQPDAIQAYPDHNPLNIMVRQESYQWSDPDFDDFVGIKYVITNIGSETLEDVYVAIFADGDVGTLDTPDYWADDATGFVSVPMACTPVGATGIEAAYVYDADGDGGTAPSYFGFMIVDHTTDPSGTYAPPTVGVSTYWHGRGDLTYEQGGDPTNDFERYELLSKQLIEQDATTPDDYRMLLAVGPFPELPPDSTIVVQVVFVAGNGLAGFEENAARAKLAFLGQWFDIDGDPTTGIAGRETPVSGPAQGVIVDPCRPGYDQPIDVPEGEVVWINTDCETETAKAATCSYGPADSLLYMTGVAGRETNVHWTLPSPQADVLAASMDIRPGSYPNPLNRKLFDEDDEDDHHDRDGRGHHGGRGRHDSPGHGHHHGRHEKGGVLPVAVLGQDGFSVEDIDLESVRLEGVAPLDLKQRLEDVGRPSGATECPLTESDPDGNMDLVLKFSAREVAQALGLADPEPGTEIELTLTGMLEDGTPFEAHDCVTIVGKRHKEKEHPDLLPPSPNPFNPVTAITYYLPEDGHVRLAVYDVSGRLVRVLEDADRSAGRHSVTWDAAGMASGVYFYRLEAAGKVLVRKAVLLK